MPKQLNVNFMLVKQSKGKLQVLYSKFLNNDYMYLNKISLCKLIKIALFMCFEGSIIAFSNI